MTIELSFSTADTFFDANTAQLVSIYPLKTQKNQNSSVTNSKWNNVTVPERVMDWDVI
ncbi:hypothetical protein [Endozoicomonas sp.]|uniref:hypothetical protein n=1 Tax=Endozoicomonas sp. TaxID=1892382 RepID=UPI00383AC2E4